MSKTLHLTERAGEKPSSKQIAALSVERFKGWINERYKANDWPDYIRAGKLNRTEIATECGFGRAAWQQNETLETELLSLEATLRSSGVLERQDTSENAEGAPEGLARTTDAPQFDASTQLMLRRAMSAKVRAEGRVKVLEEQNATLRAEVKDLRDQLKKLKLQDQHLCETGRMLPL